MGISKLQYLPEDCRSPYGRKLTSKEEEIVQRILHNKKIDKDLFFNVMTAAEREEIMQAVSAGLNTLGHQDRDRLIDQTSHLYHSDTLENVDESERTKVVCILANEALERKRFICISELSQKSGLSRKRIKRILERVANSDLGSPINAAMREALLAKIFSYGFSGNIKAARLFMELTDPNPPAIRSYKIQNQNNLVQLNGIVITEDQMRSLPPDLSAKLQEVVTAIHPATITPLKTID